MKDLESNTTVEELDLLYLEKEILNRMPKHSYLGKLEMACVIPSIRRAG